MTTKVKGTEGIEFPDSTQQSTSALTPQAWQDVTGSRTWGTEYINNPKLPIKVACVFNSTPGTNLSASAVVEGLQVGNIFIPSAMTSLFGQSLYFEVPMDATYSVMLAGASAGGWRELR